MYRNRFVGKLVVASAIGVGEYTISAGGDEMLVSAGPGIPATQETEHEL